MFDAEILARQFSRAVAPLVVTEVPTFRDRRWNSTGPDEFRWDVLRRRDDELFQLRLVSRAVSSWEFHVANADRARRHLVVVARPLSKAGGEPRHFLCGHDERHLFVVGVEARVSTVAQAMEALMPTAVLGSLAAHQVRARARTRRHNPGYVRQGEWFFLPRPDFDPGPNAIIRRHEPIARPGGRSHLVEYLYRSNGERVFVCPRYPNGVSGARHSALLLGRPEAVHWGWRAMIRTNEVYARGRVRHPDHRTIALDCWHQVVVNRAAGLGVAFLD